MGAASAKNIDFSGVKDRGAFNPKRVEEGDYAAKIVKVEDTPVKESGDFMYTFTIKLVKFSQFSYPYRCKLAENQLWKLRNIAVAGGLNVPKKRMKFDPNKLVGRTIGVTMEDDEYEGKPKSEISAVFPVSELADVGELEEDTSEDESFDEGTPVEAGGEEFDPEAGEDEAEEKPKKKKDKGDSDKKKGKKKKKDKEMDISKV
jgi:hypothetical protein